MTCFTDAGLDQFIGSGRFLATVIMFLEYGLAVASSTYCLTFLFSDHSMAQVRIISQLIPFDRKIISPHCYVITDLFYYAECGSPGKLFHRAHSYGYIFHNGANSVNNGCKFVSQG